MKHEVAPEIVKNPDVMWGAWCVSGTRIPAATIKDFWDAGYTVGQIIDQYPSLTPDAIAAAVAFVAPSEKRPTVWLLHSPYSTLFPPQVYRSEAHAREVLAIVQAGRPEETIEVTEAMYFQ